MTSLELKILMREWLNKMNQEALHEYMDKGDKYYLGRSRAFAEAIVELQAIGNTKGGEDNAI